MKRSIWILLYVIIACADLYQTATNGDRHITKPLIMLVLIAYYGLNFKSLIQGKVNVIFLLALLGAWAGDIFLLSDNLFLYGLGSFLVMQILYSICFWHNRTTNKGVWLFGGFLLIFLSIVASQLWSLIEGVRLPVLIYMLAIGTMSFTAFARDKSLNGYWSVFVGTLLFIVSDTVLGIHKFTENINLGSLTVMITYIAAQFAIVDGFISGQKDRD